MSDRSVRDLVVQAWTARLQRARLDRWTPDTAHAVALELAAIAEAHGVRFTRPAHIHDPNADWRAEAAPGDHEAGLAAARNAIRKPPTTA